MRKSDMKVHITGNLQPAHGMYEDLPCTVADARKEWKPKWKPECAHSGSVIGELAGD